MHKPITDISNY